MPLPPRQLPSNKVLLWFSPSFVESPPYSVTYRTGTFNSTTNDTHASAHRQHRWPVVGHKDNIIAILMLWLGLLLIIICHHRLFNSSIKHVVYKMFKNSGKWNRLERYQDITADQDLEIAKVWISIVNTDAPFSIKLKCQEGMEKEIPPKPRAQGDFFAYFVCSMN